MVNGWRNHQFELTVRALAIGFVVSYLATTFLRLNLLLGIVVFFIAFFLVFDNVSPPQKSIAKLYQASLSDSRQVVQNVLIQKGIPYRKSGSDCFLLEQDGIEVRMKRVQRRNGGEYNTIISLIPKDIDSWQLIHSLCQKLDEAFRPRGL